MGKKKPFFISFYHRNLSIYLDVILVCLALLSALISFFILLDLTSVKLSRDIAFYVIWFNLIFIFLLSFVIGKKLYPIIKAYWTGRSASSLHLQIISLFSIVATLPAFAVAIVATITLHFSLDRWFDNNITEIVRSSVNMANVYAEETLQRVYDAAHIMVLTLDDEQFLTKDRQKYQSLLTLQTAAQKLKGAFLLKEDGTIILATTIGSEHEIPIPPTNLINKANVEQSFLFQPGRHDYFGVITKFKNMSNCYLYVVKDVNEQVLKALRLTELNTNRYKNLQDARTPMQIAFGVLYFCLFLVMWLCAILTGVKIADRMLKPIQRLSYGADEVASGNLNIMLPVYKSDGDIGQLLKTFNYMIHELKNQHHALIRARDQIDERRRFTEAVLAGIKVGVIGVDFEGTITIVNLALEAMFNRSFEQLRGQTLFTLHPEIANIFEKARQRQAVHYYKQTTLKFEGTERVYIIQITMEDSYQEQASWVVTVDDITELILAQRSSAWADIARRIAHEIKNPLTPIQLSAERIKRRYQDVVLKDREIFDQCTDTIIRQVGDIGRMVDEFSSFARMPKACLNYIDLRVPLKEATFLVEVTRPDIIFEQKLGDDALMGYFDSRLLIQALTNLIKNATESISMGELADNEKGHILIQSYKVKIENRDYFCVEIVDNGKGFPKNKRLNLLEPYITTREKGTGLGLAIVRKIIEDHEGTIELLDAFEIFYKGRGAMVRLSFPVYVEDEGLIG